VAPWALQQTSPVDFPLGRSGIGKECRSRSRCDWYDESHGTRRAVCYSYHLTMLSSALGSRSHTTLPVRCATVDREAGASTAASQRRLRKGTSHPDGASRLLEHSADQVERVGVEERSAVLTQDARQVGELPVGSAIGAA
jgi:hypothetical protein